MWPQFRLLFDPNAAPGTGAPSNVPSPEPAAGPPSSGGPDAGFSPSEFDAPGTTQPVSQVSAQSAHSGGSPTSSAAQATQAASDWIGVRDFARARGVDLSQYGDDEQALNYLMSIAQQQREAAMYTQLGRQVAPHAEQIQQYLRQQQQPPPQTRPAYMPPPMDERWITMVDQDPATGLVYGKPGTPPEIVDAVNKRLAWQKEFNANPVNFYDQHLQSQLPTLVDRMVNDRMAAYQQQQTVDQILRENGSWLYAKDAAGNLLRGPQGYVPTPQGQQYIQNVQMLSRSGVTDPRIQNQLALRLTFSDMAPTQGQQPPSPNQNQQRGATGSPNRNAAQVNRAQGALGQEGVVDTIPEGLSLYEYMKKAMDEAGVTDADFTFEGMT